MVCCKFDFGDDKVLEERIYVKNKQVLYQSDIARQCAAVQDHLATSRGEIHAICVLCQTRVTACWAWKSVLANHMYILDLIQNLLYRSNALENIMLWPNLYCYSLIFPVLVATTAAKLSLHLLPFFYFLLSSCLDKYKKLVKSCLAFDVPRIAYRYHEIGCMVFVMVYLIYLNIYKNKLWLVNKNKMSVLCAFLFRQNSGCSSAGLLYVRIQLLPWFF